MHGAFLDLYKGLQTFAKGIKGPFWTGDQLTHADIALLPFIVRLPILEKHRDFKRAEVGHGFEGLHRYPEMSPYI